MSTRAWTPPALERSWLWITDESFGSSTASTWATTSGEVRSMFASRRATSRISSSGSALTTIAASSARMWAMTSAIVWGCSSCRYVSTWRGSVRRRNSNGAFTSVAPRFSRISRALSSPTVSSRYSRARSRPPSATCSRTTRDSWNSESTSETVPASTRSSLAISAMISATSVSRSDRRTFAARSLPMFMSTIAAFCVPEYDLATDQALRSASQPRRVVATSSGWRSIMSAMLSCTRPVSSSGAASRLGRSSTALSL